MFDCVQIEAKELSTSFSYPGNFIGICYICPGNKINKIYLPSFLAIYMEANGQNGSILKKSCIASF